MEKTDSIKLKKVDEIYSPFPSVGEYFGHPGGFVYFGQTTILRTESHLLISAALRNRKNKPKDLPDRHAEGAVYVFDKNGKPIEVLFNPERIKGEYNFGRNIAAAHGLLFFASAVWVGDAESGVGQTRYGRVHCFRESDFSFVRSFDYSQSSPEEQFGSYARSMWISGNFLIIDHYHGVEIWHANPVDPNFGERYGRLIGGCAPGFRNNFLVTEVDNAQVGGKKILRHNLNPPSSPGLEPVAQVQIPFDDMKGSHGTLLHASIADASRAFFVSNPDDDEDPRGYRLYYSAYAGDFQKLSVIDTVINNPNPIEYGGFGWKSEVHAKILFTWCSMKRASKKKSKMKENHLLAFRADGTSEIQYSDVLSSSGQIGGLYSTDDLLYVGYPQKSNDSGVVAVFEIIH